MKRILAIYLVFLKGYSVIMFDDIEHEHNGKLYGACNKPLSFDYCHNGKWGIGDTPFQAVIDCYAKSKGS